MKKILFITLLLLSIPVYSFGSSYTLTWDSNPESDIAGYNVYHSDTSGGPYTLVARLGLVTTYEGTEVIPDQAKVTKYYVVTAYDTSDLESDYSNEVSGIYNTNTKPGPPKNLKWYQRLLAWLKHLKFWS